MKFFTQTPEEMEEFAEFMEEDIENVQRVIGELMQEGIDAEFIVHPKAETVDEHTGNTGVSEEQIVKTLVFIAEKPLAVLCPGDTSVETKKLEEILDTNVRMAKPREVKEETGYIIGGVSPFDLDIPVYMEEDILEMEEVKPAAGSRVIGVNLKPEDLKQVTDAEVVDVSR
ncbi:MAG: aminoacyl-tRNA deacylase [Candidatus Nanosalina sp.]